MKTRIVKRHYCDHCRRGGFQIPAMAKHESACTANPARVCRMCLMDGDIVQAPMPDLLVAATGLDFCNPTKEQEDHLRETANNCPACILAALRQSGHGMNFDFKAESKQWMSDHPNRDEYPYR